MSEGDVMVEPGPDSEDRAHGAYSQIVELISRYNTAADALDVPTFLECFTADGTFEFVNEGLTFAGQAELDGMIRGSSRKGTHVSEGIEVRALGDSASSTSLLVEHDRALGHLLRAGTYEDELVRLGGRWLFSSRRLTYQVGGLDRERVRHTLRHRASPPNKAH
jgi:hypothetical protein